MSGPVDLTLLPASALIDDVGRVSVGGCDLAALADEFGTPLFVYDEADLRARCQAYASAFGADSVAYASKAFLCRAMAALVADEGLGLDVATGGELHIALAAGVDPARLIFHGNNKSDAELRRALDEGVGRLVLDSFDEIDRVEVLVDGGLDPPAVLIRVTPGIDAETHAHVLTGAEDSKFGFGLGSGAALEAATRVSGSDAFRFVGLHAHIGSQIHDLAAFGRAAEVLGALVTEIESETHASITELNLGGGLGIRYAAADQAPVVADYAAAIRRVLDDVWGSRGKAQPRLVVEPGRSIAGPAGLTLYRVGTVKDVPGVRTYVAVDGGMSDNPRPATYGARYEAFLPDRATADRPLTATVAGKHCEQGDVLVRDGALPADVAVGDVLCTPVTGAYGYSMASNYNAVPRPAVVFVRDGEARVVVRRESLDDLLRRDEA